MDGAGAGSPDHLSTNVGDAGTRTGRRCVRRSFASHGRSMSGIAGVVRTDGAPVAPALISGLTEALAFRGPDAQTTWCSGQTALGHTLLRTTFESAGDVQPLTIDHVVWL